MEISDGDFYFTLPASEFVKQTGENSAMSAAFNLQKDKEQNAEEWAEAYCNTAHKERARGAAGCHNMADLCSNSGTCNHLTAHT